MNHWKGSAVVQVQSSELLLWLGNFIQLATLPWKNKIVNHRLNACTVLYLTMLLYLSDMTSDLMLPLLKHAVQQHTCILLFHVVSKSKVDVELEGTLDSSYFV